MKRILLSLVVAGLAAPALAAGPQTPAPGAVTFHAFLATSAPLCLRQAAVRCVEAGWRFADRNRDGRLSLTEFEAVREELRAWLDWPGNGAAPHERRSTLFGLMIVEAIGLPRLMELYDGDKDGAIGWAELLADVRVDERPLGQVLLDPQAVDWDSLKQRLGALAPALGGIVPGAAE